MITKQDIESLNELVNCYPEIQAPLFSNEAAESLTELAFKHYPMLRVMNSASIIKFEEKLATIFGEHRPLVTSQSGEGLLFVGFAAC